MLNCNLYIGIERQDFPYNKFLKRQSHGLEGLNMTLMMIL